MRADIPLRAKDEEHEPGDRFSQRAAWAGRSGSRLFLGHRSESQVPLFTTMAITMQ